MAYILDQKSFKNKNNRMNPITKKKIKYFFFPLVSLILAYIIIIVLEKLTTTLLVKYIEKIFVLSIEKIYERGTDAASKKSKNILNLIPEIDLEEMKNKLKSSGAKEAVSKKSKKFLNSLSKFF